MKINLKVALLRNLGYKPEIEMSCFDLLENEALLLFSTSFFKRFDAIYFLCRLKSPISFSNDFTCDTQFCFTGLSSCISV